MLKCSAACVPVKKRKARALPPRILPGQNENHDRLFPLRDSNVTCLACPAIEVTLLGTKHASSASYVLWWKKAYACDRKAAIWPERRGTKSLAGGCSRFMGSGDHP